MISGASQTSASTRAVAIRASVAVSAGTAEVGGAASIQDYADGSYFAADYVGQRHAYEVPAALIEYIVLQASVYLDTRGLNFVLRDIAVALDAAAIAVGRTQADVQAINDEAAINAGKAAADSFAAADSLDRTAQFYRAFNETPVLADAWQFGADKAAQDAFAAADAYAVGTSKSLLEAFASADAQALLLGKAAADVLTLSDATAASLSKALADSCASTDAGQAFSQDYADFTYFAGGYVGESRTF